METADCEYRLINSNPDDITKDLQTRLKNTQVRFADCNFKLSDAIRMEL